MLINWTYIFGIFLILTTAACVIVLTVFSCKLLHSAKDLTDNVNSIATSVQNEIQPTLKELKEAMKSINSIANNADKKFEASKTMIATLLGTTVSLGGTLKNFTKGIIKGISFGLNLFKK